MFSGIIFRRTSSESLTSTSSSKNQRKWTKVVAWKKMALNHKRAAMAQQLLQKARKTNKGRTSTHCLTFCLNVISSTDYLTSAKARVVVVRVLTVILRCHLWLLTQLLCLKHAFLSTLWFSTACICTIFIHFVYFKNTTKELKGNKCMHS